MPNKQTIQEIVSFAQKLGLELRFRPKTIEVSRRKSKRIFPPQVVVIEKNPGVVSQYQLKQLAQKIRLGLSITQVVLEIPAKEQTL